MRLKLLFILLLFISPVVANAQTINHGSGVISVQNGNSYKVTRNLKSDNGGTVSMTFSGRLKNGKRDGVWTLKSTYNNYGGGNGYFFTGTSLMTRTYSEGILNGPYLLKQNIKHRIGSYNRYKGAWVYGPFKDDNEYVSGSFKNGKPTGKWNVNSRLLKCNLELLDGVPVGDLNASFMGGGLKMKFRDGYMVHWEPITNNTYVRGLFWDDTEDMKNLPNQEEDSLFHDLDFLKAYMQGSDLAKWIYGYPQGSSDEEISVKYKIADRDNHTKYFGNPPAEVLKRFDDEKR